MTSKLTIKQERFCQKYIECGNASEAYRFAYDVKKMTDNAIGVEAKRLLDNPKIAHMVEQSQSKTAEKHEITKDKHIANLEKLKNTAYEQGNIQAAIKAEELIGKVCGHYTQKIEHSGETVNRTIIVNPTKDK